MLDFSLSFGSQLPFHSFLSMRVVALLSSVAFFGQFALGSPANSGSQLSGYLSKEDPIAVQRILDNIGPNLGANPGIVVASPSTEDPNYLYTWTRDGALTMKSLVERLIANDDKTLIPTIEAYVKVQLTLQHISNPSGNFSDLSGLGEPKFNINATAFTGDWGRPQRDGTRPEEIIVGERIVALKHMLTRISQCIRPSVACYCTCCIWKVCQQAW